MSEKATISAEEQKTQDTLRSESLNLLRFPLAVVVICAHILKTSGYRVRGELLTLDQYPLTREFSHAFDAFFRGQSVPIYFFISGYVFFVGITLTREKYKQKMQNRSKSLLIPFLFWNTLFILISLVAYMPWFADLFRGHAHNWLDVSVSSILYSYWDAAHGIFQPPSIPDNDNAIYPHCVPLWFLRDLMIVAVSTPVIYWILKRTKSYVVWGLGAVWFAGSFFGLYHVNQLLTAFFFFTWGAYMSINKKDMLREFGRFRNPSIAIYIGLSLLYIAAVHWKPEAATVIKQMNIVVGLLCAYNVSSYLLEHHICRPNKFLASASFFMYVSHFLTLEYLEKILFVVVNPASAAGMMAVCGLTLVITLAGWLTLFRLMRRYTPGVLKVIAGRK